jgi:deazaflavin-dependent oxidoreductase (nitroreductase family)
MENAAKSRPGGWFAVHVASPIDRRLLRWTNGRVGMFIGQPVGLLYARGAKSGAVRETPLLYCADGERILLVASNAGSTRHPAWYHNVTANPDVEFLPRRGPRRPYRARQLEGAEREAAWEKVNDLYAGYETYQGRAGSRRIPVIALEPR